MNTRRDDLTRRWRKASGGKWGRLYWRHNDRMARFRDWERGEVARVIDHALITHYFTYAALEADIVEMEKGE